MDKYVFLESEYRGMDMRSGWIHHNYYDACSGQAYYDFIDYAFSICDYFMLVYVNYCGKGFTKTMKAFRKALSPYRVKSRSNASWPGTLMTYCANTIYRVIFYRTEEAAKEVLKRVSSISDWCRPAYPQDLAFFKGNICWFASTAHERRDGFACDTGGHCVFNFPRAGKAGICKGNDRGTIRLLYTVQ